MPVCAICESNFPKTTNKKYCSPECGGEAARRRYRETNHEKQCQVCSKTFLGTGNRAMCSDCRAQGIARKFPEIECQITCRQCDANMGTVIKKRTKTNEVSKTGLCQACRDKNKKAISERMQQHNPMEDTHVREKAKSTRKNRWETDAEFRNSFIARIREGRKNAVYVPQSPEARERARKRMMANNPMKDPAIQQKVKESRRKNGKQMPKGAEHKNWKGNRNRAQTIRTRLYPVWTYPILERAEFKCELCDASRVKLEVHHASHSFQECLLTCLDGADIKALTDSEFEAIIQKVIEAHASIQGVTVCVPCHRRIDKQRH